LAQQDSPGAAAALRAHGQGGYFVSASGVSAPPYGRQEPSEIVVEQLRCGIVVPMPSSSLATTSSCQGFLLGEFSSNAQQPTEAFEMDEPYRGYVPRSPFSVRDKTLGRRQAALFLGCRQACKEKGASPRRGPLARRGWSTIRALLE
jgi:hypothetical protein